PIGAGEGQRGRADGALVCIAAAQIDRDVGGRLAVELDGEGRSAASLGRVAADAPDIDPSGVVVGVDDRHIGGVQTAVPRVCADSRGSDDLIGNIVIVYPVVALGAGPALFRSPIGAGEGQRGRANRALGSVAAA